MQTKTLKLLAIGLVSLSLTLAIAGYRLSQTSLPKIPATSISQPSHRIVAAARELTPGTILKPEDIALIASPFPMENVFSDTSPLIGRTVHRALHKGELFNEDAFRPGSILARETAPGLRAVAIRIDETAGVGGFLRPGDFVDVYYTVQAAHDGKARSLAGSLVHNVRLIAFGNELVERAPAKDDDSGKRSRSAVLEVRPADVSRLLLAETNGALRLAAMGSHDVNRDRPDPAALHQRTHPSTFVSLSELSGARITREPSETIEVYQGDQVNSIDVTGLERGAKHHEL